MYAFKDRGFVTYTSREFSKCRSHANLFHFGALQSCQMRQLLKSASYIDTIYQAAPRAKGGADGISIPVGGKKAC